MITKTIAKKQNKTQRADRHGDIIVASDRYAQVDNFFFNLSLSPVDKETKYWEELTIRDDAEYFDRWVFAIMSVHTTWESNVRG